MMLGLRPVSFFVRIMAAMLTCISMSAATVLIDYVPAAQQLENTYYYPLWYSLLITMLIHLAIVIFLILPLSILTDAVSVSVAHRSKGVIHRAVSLIVGYVLLAGLSGILFSVFVYRGNTILYMGAIRQLFIITLIFVSWQYILRAGAGWLNINKQAKTG